MVVTKKIENTPKSHRKKKTRNFPERPQNKPMGKTKVKES